jgi:hypothetical protein
MLCVIHLLQDPPFNPTALDHGPRVTNYGEYTVKLQDDIDLILAE